MRRTRIVVAGATGTLGRATVPALRRAGHDVVGLATSSEGEARVRALHATPVRASIDDPDAIVRSVGNADALVRVATRIGDPAAPAWPENDRLRREGTRALLDAARRLDASFLQESIVWIARPPDGGPFDESSPLHLEPRTASAAQAEAAARDAAARHGTSTATLRLGWLYGPGSGSTETFAHLLHGGRLPVGADWTAPLAFLHMEDAGSAFAAAVDRAASGLYHVVAEAAPAEAFFLGLAERLRAPAPTRPPVVHSGGFFTTPMRTNAARFRAATGWTPAFPTLGEGLDATVRALAPAPS